MLGKLMKYEWKNVYKFGSIMILTVLVMTTIGYFFLSSSVVGDFFAGDVVLSDTENLVLVLTSVSSLLVYYLVLIGALYGILIYMGVRFYKTMYTDQGYLTNTLPVTPGKILTSKILVSGSWVFLSYMAVYVSIAVLLIGLVQGMTGGVSADISFAEFWEAIILLYEEIGMDVKQLVIIMILSCLISPFTSVIQIFGALTIGQLSKKYKLLMSILVYIGLTIASSIIVTVIEGVMMMGSIVTATGDVSMEFVNSSCIFALLYSAVISIVLVLVSHRIIKKKLNMD